MTGHKWPLCQALFQEAGNEEPQALGWQPTPSTACVSCPVERLVQSGSCRPGSGLLLTWEIGGLILGVGGPWADPSWWVVCHHLLSQPLHSCHCLGPVLRACPEGLSQGPRVYDSASWAPCLAAPWLGASLLPVGSLLRVLEGQGRGGYQRSLELHLELHPAGGQ